MKHFVFFKLLFFCVNVHCCVGVLYVAEFAPVFKHDPAGNDQVLSHIHIKHTERREKLLESGASRRDLELLGVNFERVKLHVTLASKNSQEENEHIAKSWITELASEFGIHDLQFEHASHNRGFVTLSTGKESALNVIRNLASFHEVIYYYSVSDISDIVLCCFMCFIGNHSLYDKTKPAQHNSAKYRKKGRKKEKRLYTLSLKFRFVLSACHFFSC